MAQNPTDRAPWRVLVFDHSGDDPKWIIATVRSHPTCGPPR